MSNFYEGLSSIEKISFGNAPQKVEDPLLEEEFITVRNEQEEDVELPEPDESEYETVEKVEYSERQQVGDDDDDDYDDSGAELTEDNLDAKIALVNQIVEGFVKPGIVYIGNTQYDKWVQLSETLKQAKIRIETKMSDGKATPPEQKMYGTILTLQAALNEAKMLYKANLPLTAEETKLTEQAILDYLKIKKVEVTPEQIVLTNIFSILSKRTMPIINDRNRFYKAEV